MDKNPTLKIGIMVDNLGPSQLSFAIISEVSKITERLNVCPTIFYDNLVPHLIEPRCIVIPTVEAWSFKGLLIATNLNTANKLIRIPTSEQKIFYVWNIEWLGNHIPYYEPMQFVYGNDSLKIITRNEDHTVLLKNSFNVKPLFSVNDFNLEEMLRNLNERKRNN